MSWSLLVLCLCLAGTLATPAGHFAGRSGDIILESTPQQDSVIFFKGDQISTTSLTSLPDTTFADLVAHVMGTQPFHVDAKRDGFPTSSLFNKPKAALLVSIDSVGAELLNKYPTLSLIKDAHASAITSSSSNTHSLLATLATGTTVSQHGIVGASWRRPSGTLVNAYDSEGLSFSANVADILLQETRGQSLVISASSSPAFASALAAHNELIEENLGWRAHAYAFSAEEGAFVSRYADPSTDQVLSISADELASLVADTTVQGVTFSTETPEDMALLAELAFVKNLIMKLSSDASLSALVADSVPDMYSFVFASLKGIQSRYGSDSAAFSAALGLVDKAAESLFAVLNAQYDNRVAAAFLALNARDTSSEALKQRVYKKVSNLLYSDEEFAAFFPDVYLRPLDFNRGSVCASVQQAAANEAKVICASPVAPARSTPTRSTRGIRASAGCTPNATVDPYYASDLATVWAFWLNFFITIFITAFILWGAYCLVYVGADASKDSLLFLATGRHHHQN